MTPSGSPGLRIEAGEWHLSLTPRNLDQPAFAVWTVEGGGQRCTLYVPIFGKTTYRCVARAPVDVGFEDEVVAATFVPPASSLWRRPTRRFEKPAALGGNGLRVVPVSYCDGGNQTAALEFMREIRAMRERGMYPIGDARFLGRVERRPGLAALAGEAPVATAVVAHLHYRDLWDELADRIATVPGQPEVVITVTTADQVGDKAIRASFPQARIVPVENRGFDVAPFMHLLASGALDRAEIICKVHGKKSRRKDGSTSLDGAVWRRASLDALLGDRLRVAAVLARFQDAPDLGVVGPRRFHIRQTGLGRFVGMGRNRRTMMEVAGRMGIAWHKLPLDYFAGSMFWARRAALEPLRTLAMNVNDFPASGERRDGTLAHALERLFNVAAMRAGFRIEDVDDAASALAAQRA